MCDYEPTELDDAIIEDTVYCSLCGGSWVLGGTCDGIVVTLVDDAFGRPFTGSTLGGQLKLCVECSLQVKREVEMMLAEQDRCEHGVVCGEWCQVCNEDYKIAMSDPDNNR